MRPFYFGTSQQSLFGTYSPAAIRPARRLAVLLCNPFGHEAIFAHRTLRVLADRLSRNGFPVMRFDYFATGDSSGDCEAATLAQWVDDAGAASEELVDTAGVQSVAWIGLRLGATIAALASARRARPLSGVVLWEPVVDGLAYLEELRQAHLRLLAEDLDFPPPHPFGTGSASAIEIDQALGFVLPRALREEIGALDAGKLASPVAHKVFVVAGAETGPLRALRHALEPLRDHCSWNLVGPGETWNSEQALNSSVIPVGAINAVIECLETLR